MSEGLDRLAATLGKSFSKPKVSPVIAPERIADTGNVSDGAGVPPVARAPAARSLAGVRRQAGWRGHRGLPARQPWVTSSTPLD